MSFFPQKWLYLIDKSVMEASVNPVDEHVSEKEEGQDTNNEMKPAWRREQYKTESRPSLQD